MPIEILPAGLPDWIQFDSTDDIDFLVEDPFWPTKVGSNNPDLAILYRSHNPGTLNFIEKSEDGGKTWTWIVLPDTLPWYSGATFTHMNPPGYGLTYEPTPKIDPALSRPHATQLTYRAYASNPAHIGEHAVLATHNYVDGVDSGWDLASMWVAYTFDDWVVTRWQQILPDMEYWHADINEGSSTQIATGISINVDAVAMAKISDTKIAAFSWAGSYYEHYTVRAFHLTPNGTFTLDNAAVQSNSYADTKAFVFGNKVYFGSIVEMIWEGNWAQPIGYHHYDRVKHGGKFYLCKRAHNSAAITEPGVGANWTDEWWEDYADLPVVEPARTEPYTDGENIYLARVQVWDFSGTTPVFEATYESEELPSYYGEASPKFVGGSGDTWAMTDSGRLAFTFFSRDGLDNTSGTTARRIWLFYFDGNSDVFSEPYLYMEGTGLTGVPKDGHMYFNAETYDGGSGALVCETRKVTWLNRAIDDWYGRLYMIDVGGWYKYDEVELFEDLDASSGYATYVKDCKKLDHSRFAFHYDRGGAVIASYDAAYHRINEVYEKLQYDSDDSGSPTIMMQEDPITDQVFMSGYGAGDTKSAMFWSRWSVNQPSYPRDPYADILDDGDDFRYKVAFWSDENTPTMHIAFGSHDKYGRVWKSGSNLLVSITTVDSRPVSDTIYSRFYLGTMAFTNDGERLYFGTGDYKTADSSKINTWLEYLTRNPSSPDYSTQYRWGYDNNFGYGWRSTPAGWGDIDENVDIADFLAGESYFNVVTWPVEDDGIILYGLMQYQRVPTSPDQIWIYSAATNWDVLWDNGHAGGYVDPVRALIYYNELIYAAIKTSTGIELYVSDAPPYGGDGDYMSHLSDSFLDDCGIACMDYDPVDGTLVIGQKVANLLMIAATPTPYTTWYNLTLSHRNDLGLTGLVVL